MATRAKNRMTHIHQGTFDKVSRIISMVLLIVKVIYKLYCAVYHVQQNENQ